MQADKLSDPRDRAFARRSERGETPVNPPFFFPYLGDCDRCGRPKFSEAHCCDLVAVYQKAAQRSNPEAEFVLEAEEVLTDCGIIV
jgi:hypothetical protein